MKEYQITASLDGHFLFRTDWDNYERCTKAADAILKGCPQLKLMLISQDKSMQCVDYTLTVFPFNSRLINLENVESGDGLTNAQIDMLLSYQFAGLKVKVLCQAADGYYDVELPNGSKIDALSSCHLESIPKAAR